MKRFFKKSTAIVLCLCMIFCAVPIGAFALTDDVQTDVRNDISTQATSAFGSMLTDAIDSQDIDADSPYFISDLIFDGNKATASYYNEAACTLVVAVYDEETEQMLDSAVTSVEAESLEKAVSFSSLPENFVAKAFLLDENNASLCKPYTCNENTTAYKEFIGKSVEDFDEDRVINLDESLTNNFVVLTDDTIVVSGNNETNVLESADVENDEYVFSNIDEQIKNLRVGDMFYLDNGDEENITVIKVASISIEGDKAVIIADNTSLAEAFEYVKIDTEAQTDDMGYDGTNADEGVTYLGNVDYETGEPIAPDGSEIGTQAVEIDESEPYSKLFEYEYEDITATVIFQATVSLKAHFGLDYGDVTFTVDPSAKLAVVVEEETHKEINFGKLPVVGIKGAAIYIEPTIVFEFSGKLTVTGELTFTLGFGWNSSSGFVNKCKKPSFKPVVKVEATFFIGFDLKPQFVLIHENVASARLSGLVGAEIEALLTTELEEGHSCVSCLDGVVNGKVDISVTLSVVKTMPFGGEYPKELYSRTDKIADFYFSVGHVSFGWGECPYKDGGSGGGTGDDTGDSGEGGDDSGNDGSGDNSGIYEQLYWLSFRNEDGSVFESKFLHYGDPVEIPQNAPEKEFHIFKGWTDVPETMPAESVFCYPIFERIPVKLILDEGSELVIDYDNHYIYGLKEYMQQRIFMNDLTVQSDGYATFVNDHSQSIGRTNASTGDVVELYDNLDTSEPIDVFYVILFGDINGDSLINEDDVQLLEDEALFKTAWSYPAFEDYLHYRLKAGDLNKDGRITQTDVSILELCVAGGAKIDQATGDCNIIVTGNEDVGDTVYFGSYPQSKQSDGTYKVEPIEWRVLENNNGELLLLSEKVLDAQPYNKTYEDITWADCSLRTWLNNDFYNTAFTDSEKTLISTSYLTNEDNPEYGTESGDDTQDRIFILSYSDVLNADYGFLTSIGACDTRESAPTDYSIDSEVFWSEHGAFWWLRTPSGSSDFACLVGGYGNINTSGYCVDHYYLGVRPALRINLNSTALSSLETQSVSTSLDNGVDTVGFSYDKCIAGNTYTLLNVTGYGEGFELSSDNLYYINTVSADENGKVTASFIPKTNAENSVILLVGDFGNGTETVVIGDWYNEYTVTWNTDGETVTQTVIEGAEIIAPDIPEKVGYTFTGWTPSIPATMPDYDLTFTATWKVNTYDAVFNANSGAWADGATEMTVSTEYGAEIISPENPVKTGYTFTGWTPAIPDTMPDYDLTFTATWAVNSYDAVFDANGGAWADGATEMTVSTEYGAKIIAPEIPSKQGYIFSKWSPEIGVMDSVDGKIFTAEWIPATDTRYTVETYTMNTAGEYEKTVQTLGGTTGETVSTNPEIKTGFALNSEKSVLSGTVAADNSLILKVFIDRNTYTFTTVVDNISSETKYYYGSIISDPVPPTKEGYKFIGWDTEIPSTMPAENVTVTAMFEISYVCPDCGLDFSDEAEYEKHISTHNKPSKITITGGKITNGELIPGATITIIAEQVNGKIFSHWVIEGATVTDTNSSETTVILGSGEITITAEYDDCECKCHQGGLVGFFYKIILFFQKLFGNNLVCFCGAKH